VYRSEGALWLRTTTFGDDKDRVVVRSNGQPTYLAADIAYIQNKRERGVERQLIPLGSDHTTYAIELKAAMAAVQHHRETVQPIREKTGGSTFKNPEGTSAWKEIDAAGCRGMMIGGAQMSPMHCNFMINTGTAA